MRHFAVSAIGRDRPGIVAAVTRTLLDHDVNVEDSQSTILRGHFAMTLIVSGPDGLELVPLRADLARTATELRLGALAFDEIEDAEPGGPAEPSHMVTVYGAYQPRIVNAVTSALSDCGVNITDLNTRVVDEPDDGDLYAMMLEVALPPGLDVESLEGLLEATRREQGVELTVRALEPAPEYG